MRTVLKSPHQLSSPTPRRRSGSGFDPEVVVLLATVTGAILFMALRVLSGAL